MLTITSSQLRVVDPPPDSPYPYICISMRSGSRPVLFNLLLVLALLGAQFHLCADFAVANSAGSHVCQLCATAGHAVIAPSLVADHTPVVCRMESSYSQGEVPALAFSDTSPRAPPSL